MKITCENCVTVYEVPDEKLKGNEVIECPVCQYLYIRKGSVDLPPEADTVKNEAVTAEKEKDYGKTMYTELDASGNVKKAEVAVTEGRQRGLPEDKELILLVEEGGVNKEYPIKISECTIGRGQGSDIILNDPEVSRTHCVIDVYKDKFVIRDLESTNGTYLNDTRIKEDILKGNDRIRVGNTLMKFVIRELQV